MFVLVVRAMPQLQDWLKENKFEKYTKLFENEDLKYKHLPLLTHSMLKEMNIPFADRVLMIDRIKHLKHLEKKSATLQLNDGSRPSSELIMSNLDSYFDEKRRDVEVIQEEEEELVWTVGQLIGRGSFGSVYLSLNSTTGELMAVKQITATERTNLDVLNQEIGFLKELEHENVVKYIGISNDAEFFYIFLEYVPGGSISSLLTNYGQFEEPLIKTFTLQLLNGLSYLHSCSIVHRDIKAANVLVDNKGCIKISDFGLSTKIGQEKQIKNTLHGSVFWMAPEVVKSMTYTFGGDIWSVGCVVIEMLTGSHPWPELNPTQAMFRIGNGNAPEFPRGISKECFEFLNECFVLDYTQRPTCEDLLGHKWLQ